MTCLAVNTWLEIKYETMGAMSDGVTLSALVGITAKQIIKQTKSRLMRIPWQIGRSLSRDDFS